MKNEKLKTIFNLFQGNEIRSIWDSEKEEYYYSVVDVIGALTESNNPRNYWKVLKHRLKQEGNQSVTNCNQLKLKAIDGKYYSSDAIANFLDISKEEVMEITKKVLYLYRDYFNEYLDKLINNSDKIKELK